MDPGSSRVSNPACCSSGPLCPSQNPKAFDIAERSAHTGVCPGRSSRSEPCPEVSSLCLGPVFSWRSSPFEFQAR